MSKTSLGIWTGLQQLTLACSLLLVSLSGLVSAHPFHISTAEVEYDVPSRRLQVSLKLQAIDLEHALARQEGRRIDIEHVDGPKLITAFLERSFFLCTKAPEPSQEANEPSEEKPVAGERSRVHWVGQELKGAWLWLYFELELPTSQEPLWLVNSVLFNVNTQQINTVSVRHGTQRTTLKMTANEPSAKFESTWMHRD